MLWRGEACQSAVPSPGIDTSLKWQSTWPVLLPAVIGVRRSPFLGSRDSAVCGVGIYGGGWGETRGYSHLHRNVPIVLILNVSDFKKEASRFDYVILPLRLREMFSAGFFGQ